MNKVSQQFTKTKLNFDKELGGGYVYIEHSISNCKLTTIEFINGIYGYSTTEAENERMKKKMNLILKECRIVTHINTSSVAVKDFLEANYEIYSISKVPVGYGGGYQWYIMLRNKIGQPNSCMRPTEWKGEVKASAKMEPALPADKEKMKVALTAALKSRRRKTDVVDEIIAQL